MTSEPISSDIQRVRKFMGFGALFALALIGYGLLRFPATLTASSDGIKGLLADIFILALYACLGIFGTPRMFKNNAAALRVAVVFGMTVSAVYLFVVVSEYLIRYSPAGGKMLGIGMVAAIFSLFFLAGVRGAYLSGRFRCGVLAAIQSALLATLLWFCAVMTTYYLFLGTPQQDHVLYVENHDDFVHSGMTDFRAFIMQDFMGACFFHLLISPLFAAILGSVGSVIGISASFLRKRTSSTNVRS